MAYHRALRLAFVSLVVLYTSEGFANETVRPPQQASSPTEPSEDEDWDEEGGWGDLDEDDDEEGDEDELLGHLLTPAPSASPVLHRRRGRQYDPLPKMDHFACKSDGLCIRPLGERSLRVGLRSGESEVLVETLYAGDGKTDLYERPQWCIRLTDRGLGKVAVFPNGHCPQGWSTNNDHPKFTPTDQILADARASVNLVARRRNAFAELVALLEATPVTTGKEAATQNTISIVKHYVTYAAFRSPHDDTVAALARDLAPHQTIAFRGGQFVPQGK